MIKIVLLTLLAAFKFKVKRNETTFQNIRNYFVSIREIQLCFLYFIASFFRRTLHKTNIKVSLSLLKLL